MSIHEEMDEIERLCMHVLETDNPKKIEQRLKLLFKHYRQSAFSVQRGATYWRARKLVDNQVFTNVSEITCPPKSLTVAGRINDPRKPVLYIATRKETALAEINVEEGDSVQLAGFSIRDEAELKMAVVGMYWRVSKNGGMPLEAHDPEHGVLRILNEELSPEDGLKLVYIDKFFATLLADKNARENKYIHTRVLSKMLMKRNDAQALAYPSIKDEGAYNIAIEEEVVNSLLKNTANSVAKITKKLKYGLYVGEVFKVAIGINREGHFSFRTYESPLSLAATYFYNQTSESDKESKKILRKVPTS